MALTTFMGVHIRPSTLSWILHGRVKFVQMSRPIKMCEFITLYLFVSLSGWSASHVARAVYKEHTEQVHGGMTAETQTARCLNRTINSDRKRQKLCAKSVNIVWKAVAGILYGSGHLGLRRIACWRKANVGRDRAWRWMYWFTSFAGHCLSCLGAGMHLCILGRAEIRQWCHIYIVLVSRLQDPLLRFSLCLRKST